jgi:hypothetical protein
MWLAVCSEERKERVRAMITKWIDREHGSEVQVYRAVLKGKKILKAVVEA